MLYCEVALSLPLEKTFHYSIPENLRGTIAPGMRVVVPFGKSKSVGFVLKLLETSDVETVKDIISSLDSEPILTPQLLSLAEWISKSYCSSLGEALFTIIPGNLRAPKRIPKNKPGAEALPEPDNAHTLSEAQEKSVMPIYEAMRQGKNETFLLHGVTSSGKTEVYLNCIRDSLSRGRPAIFLLPEISLTPQFIKIVKGRFPGRVGVWHSQLSAGERYRTWDAARRGEISVMLGARSAVFAPFKNPGLIIIDEEHESTYKQENRPAYLTRDVAIARAAIEKAAVVLGSATPSVESYWKAKKGEFTLLELSERVDSRNLPPVRIVESGHLGRASKILSKPLIEALTRVLARREQAIIFLNRRGFSPGIICPSCGQVWQCPHCAISLVFHREPEGLKCHYCGYSQAWPGKCPSCGENNLALFGVGTQKVEMELKRLFPQGRVFRLDRDTASKKGVYETAYREFKNENFDILLGTQMVAKGFDFPRVTLVGVVDADTALYLPDFRAPERTFQLITQVAGRSGRSDLGGEVIVQSKHSSHYALLAAQKHDYASFYEKELEFRRQTNYPPFTRLCNMIFRGRNEKRVMEGCAASAEALSKIIKENKLSLELLGPSQAAHSKLRNLFRYQLLLKGGIKEIYFAADKIRSFNMPGVLVNIDIDPLSII